MAAVALGLAVATLATADDRSQRMRAGDQRAVQMDGRYGHNRAYPARGVYLNRLPEGALMERYGGGAYYFHGGSWYRPYGGRYVVAVAPLGAFVPFLPPLYSTVWFSGIPYYYANETYYLWNADRQGYIVSQPPAEPAAASTQAPAMDQLFVYPRNGQSDEQVSKDRYDCYAWARQQTGYDPTQSLGGVDAAQVNARRQQYDRAEQACLEGRGYTVR
jgi:hypothetical protein